MERVNRDHQPCRRPWASLTLCVLLSLLLHLGLAWALDLLPRGQNTPGQCARAARPAPRHLQIRRAAPALKKPSEPQEHLRQETKATFVKTTADEPERRPEQADFVSNHASVASGGDESPQHPSDEPLPFMTGRESEDEIVTFDQERQDGALEHEGKAAETAPPPTPPESPPSPTPQDLAQGTPDGSPERGEPEGEGKLPPQPAPQTTAAQKPQPNTPGEGLKLSDLSTEDALTLHPNQPPPSLLGQPNGTQGKANAAARPSHARLLPRDPTLAHPSGLPGLRTHERRTRSTGSFIFGRRPSLNVDATARGRYEAEIYRRIARVWYAACDEHRGDIIPGSITVSLRLTKSGRIDSMDLVRRRGASISQQSFSFSAIRQSALPPMPAEVQKELIGELYEMILTFNFD